jgi:hypothetical protein
VVADVPGDQPAIEIEACAGLVADDDIDRAALVECCDIVGMCLRALTRDRHGECKAEQRAYD